MRAANAAAAVVVGKRGTATVSAAELRHRILPAAIARGRGQDPVRLAELDAELDAWRKQGLRIGFTNGCFDILHPGHVRLLAQARAACDRLVVGLNSDASVSRLKGPERPVQKVQARAEVLAALEAVDLVVVFEEDTPRNLIAGAAERSDQGRRLYARAGGRPRDRRGLWRRGGAGRICCPAIRRATSSSARAAPAKS